MDSQCFKEKLKSLLHRHFSFSFYNLTRNIRHTAIIIIAMAIKDEDVEQLTSMGFPKTAALEALQITSGNLEMAVNHLLSGGVVDTPASASPAVITSPVMDCAAAPPAELSGSTDAMAAKAGGVLRGSTSQYTYAELGRSACTCIALTGATMFLQDQNVTPEFLDRMITGGVQNYQMLTSNQQQQVEHLSAEEVLQKDQGNLFQVKSIGGGSSGGIRQGILTHDANNPLGMKSLLEGIRHDFHQTKKSSSGFDGNEWICIIITKTPETVLLCFPPDGVSPSSYWLIDSHPRPQWGLDTSYAKLHTSLDALLMSLDAIFPPTDLGPGVPELMAMMYNSFDLYPLERRR
jgi:hypothetical protein